MTKLTKRWGLFLSIVLDPWTLCFLFVIAFLVYKSLTQTPQSITSSTLFTLLITFTSAVLGGRIAKQWVDVTEGGILVARGKAAVRGLKLLLSSIISLDKRISYYLTQPHIEKASVTKIILEEIRERCNILAEESVSSIENWTDIIPEADVKTHIGVISDLKYQLESTAKEMQSLNAELSQTKDKSKEDLDDLMKRIKDKDNELSKLERELRRKAANFGLSFDPTSGSSATIATISGEASLPFSFKGDRVISIKGSSPYSLGGLTVDKDEDKKE